MLVLKKTPVIAAMILIALVTGCANEDATPARESSSIDKITTENGYLVFSNENHFNKTLEEVGKLSAEKLNAFEKQYGFTSKRTMINEALEYYGTATLADFKKSKYNDLIVIGKDETITVAFPLLQRAALLNEDGIVKIGNDILVFKNEKVITLINGGLSRLKEAEQMESSDAEKGIVISEIVTRFLDGATPLGRTQGSGYAVPCSYTAGGPGYITQIAYSSYSTGTAPVEGHYADNYEVTFRAVSQNYGPQFPISANLTFDVSYAQLYYHPGSGIVPLVQYYNNSSSANTYVIQYTMFTGTAFVLMGDDFHPVITVSFSFMRNGTLLCSQTMQPYTL